MYGALNHEFIDKKPRFVPGNFHLPVHMINFIGNQKRC